MPPTPSRPATRPAPRRRRELRLAVPAVVGALLFLGIWHVTHPSVDPEVRNSWSLPAVRPIWRAGRGGIAGEVRDVRTGRSLEGVRLALRGTGFGGERVERALVTDASGEFRTADVAAGVDYELRLHGESRPWVKGIAVPDRAVADVGVVWDGPRENVRGKVVVEEGLRVMDARVALRCILPKATWLETGGFFDPPAGYVRPMAALATTRTGWRGEFEFRDVPPGRYSVCVLAEGCRANHRAVTVGAGETSVRLEVGDGARGTVHDVEGRPVAGAIVAWAETVTDWRRSDVGLFDRVLTDEEGRFELDPCSAEHSWNVLVRSVDGPPALLELSTTQTAPHALVLHPHEDVEVHVVRDEDGAPLPDARFALYCDAQPGRDDGAASVGTGYTDGSGRARVRLPQGDVEAALVHHPECGSRVWERGQRLTSATLAAPKDARAGPGGRRIELRLQRGRTITGTVVNARGAPLPYVSVRAVAGFRQVVGGAITDARGAFLLHAGQNALGQGPIHLRAERRGWEQITEREPIEIDWGIAQDVTERRLVLRPSGSIAGRVVDGHGKPVARALVSAEPAEGEGVQESDPSGEIEPPPPTLTADDGTYELRGPFPARIRLAVRRLGFHGIDVFKDAPAPGVLLKVDMRLD